MLFIESAQAQSNSGAGQPDIMFQFILFAGLFGLMYFMIIRPQRKRQKEHANLIGSLGTGHEVLLTSGLLGKITKLDGDYLILNVAKNMDLKFQKSAVHAVLPKGTIKAI